jgi:hypothetical protein
LLDGFVLLSVGLNLDGLDETRLTPAALWLAVVAIGLYHGVNPGMGWPLAVSAGLMERSSRALVAALWPLTVGHLLAMLVVILPFSLLVALVQWQRQIRIGAGLLVIGFGIFRFVSRRHPRVLARIRPTQLALWSFAVAIAHGAGLMLVPIYLGLCRAADLDRAHEAAGALIDANLGMAVLVSVVHSVAMIAAGGFLAWLVYRYLGLKFVSRSWFNLDATWAISLILVGVLSLSISLGEPALSRPDGAENGRGCASADFVGVGLRCYPVRWELGLSGDRRPLTSPSVAPSGDRPVASIHPFGRGEGLDLIRERG